MIIFGPVIILILALILLAILFPRFMRVIVIMGLLGLLLLLVGVPFYHGFIESYDRAITDGSRR